MARARARNGTDRRARRLHSAVAAPAEGILEHRHPHRGRRAGDQGRSGSADRRTGENPGGGRAPGLCRMSEKFDIAIVGGGMVGASLAVALEGLGLRVALIEAVPHDSASQPSFDERTTALSNGSRRILETLGLWSAVSGAATPIRKIHVSDQGRFGFARVDAAEQGLTAMGYVVPNRSLGTALWTRLSRSESLRVFCPAHVTRVLPTDRTVELIISEEGSDDVTIEARLVIAADGAQSAVRSACVVVGNAAQGLHPVAGMGFNLGLRDVASLAELVADQQRAAQPDLGDGAVQADYDAWRAADRSGIIAFTDGLIRVFSNPLGAVQRLRNLGLLAFDVLPPAKSALSRLSTGASGRIPKLARGVALR